MNTNQRLALAVAVLAGAYYMTTKTARGIRNNNPLNIREGQDGGDLWQGEAPGNWDADFEEFTDPRYGYRAAARILQNYGAAGIVTLRQIINRWAPPEENNTDAYVNSMAAKLGIDPDGSPWHLLPELLAAMTVHENGHNPYSLELIKEGVSWA